MVGLSQAFQVVERADRQATLSVRVAEEWVDLLLQTTHTCSLDLDPNAMAGRHRLEASPPLFLDTLRAREIWYVLTKLNRPGAGSGDSGSANIESEPSAHSSTSSFAQRQMLATH